MIQVGEVLDKYELLERVGQGGMAVVYRGLDRSLKRVVAVKILHKHLSDYQEARDRFEREAQAVAKLRHENILEIFDYSGAEDAKAVGSSYIVTEFIDGRTLKQAVTDRPIAFPEIGAMVVLQVARALAHAHSVGILHRDVKPENIMVRADGVVKLMDFGISHMVDLERLTVTGQLLGSPAYMAPEHVEGRPLDFRTDVFAVGIVLYQLTTGRLPFEGKNPHEVLKRIAECKFVDPRQLNPRIGNRLGRIILKAMAARPDDRYAAIGELVVALEGYLEECGLAADRVAAELARYFQTPAPYELALEERLIDHLTRRGQQLLDDDDRAGALDVFDRVLTIDADNAKVLAILEGINRRLRLRAATVALGIAGGLGGAAFMLHRELQPPPAEPPPAAIDERPVELPPPPTTLVARDHAWVPPDAAPAVAVADPPDAPPVIVRPRPEVTPDAAPAVVVVATKIRVFPPNDAEYSVAGGPAQAVPASGLIALDLTDAVDVRVWSRTTCCQETTQTIKPGGHTTITTPYLPASVIAACDDDTVTVRVDGRPARLGHGAPVPFDGSIERTRTAEIAFFGARVDPAPIKVTVTAGAKTDVKCVVR